METFDGAELGWAATGHQLGTFSRLMNPVNERTIKQENIGGLAKGFNPITLRIFAAN